MNHATTFMWDAIRTSQYHIVAESIYVFIDAILKIDSHYIRVFP
jgi:hypothetical protein